MTTITGTVIDPNPLVDPYVYVPPGPTPAPPPAPATLTAPQTIKSGDATWGQTIPSSFGIRRCQGVPIWFNGIQTAGAGTTSTSPPPVIVGPPGPNPEWP